MSFLIILSKMIQSRNISHDRFIILDYGTNLRGLFIVEHLLRMLDIVRPQLLNLRIANQKRTKSVALYNAVKSANSIRVISTKSFLPLYTHFQNSDRLSLVKGNYKR